MAKLTNLTHRSLRTGLLTAFVTIATWYSVMIPPGEGVDEVPHFDYVRYVKENRNLPVQPMTREHGVQVSMGHHPPLYYVLGAVAISWCDTSDYVQVFRPNPHFVWRENDGRDGWNVMLHFGQHRFPWKGPVLALHVVRLMTVALGTIALYAIYRAAERMFPSHHWMPLGIAAVVGFNPSFVFMCSTVHHDTLQAAIFSLTIWQCIQFLNGPGRRCDALFFGLLLGLAPLTKLSGLGLAPVVVLAFLLKAQRQQTWKRHLQQVLYTLIIAALVSGWWFARNQWLYGDPLGWQMFLNIHKHMMRSSPYTWQAFSDFLAQIGRTFWGAFGYMHITFPDITKYLWWLTGIAGIGLVVGTIRGQRTIREHWAEWMVTLGVLLVLFASFVRFSIATVGAGHGRYLFPAGFSIGALLIVGLNGFARWRYQQHAVSIAVLFGMLAYAVWLPASLVRSKYTPPATVTAEQLAKARALGVQFAEGVELVGYCVDDCTGDSRVFPGQWLPVSLYWKASGEPDNRQDSQVHVTLVDEQGSTIASQAAWPVPSMPPDVWSPDEVYLMRTVLGLPSQELPAHLFLTVAPMPGTGQEPRQSDIDRVHLGEIMTVGGLGQVEPEDVPNARQEIFASVVKLVGYEISPDAIGPGDSLTISLYWRVLEKPPADYTVFIHVLNDSGELVTQFDRPAGGNAAPTSTWQAGQTLRDAYPLSVPEDVSPGTYTIRTGMYIWPSMERLPISIRGKAVEKSFIDLCTVRIGP
jgi:4-amino-4-deoxy-L-arabinose transferase-like glycosyltransferase